jgi:hypothetical protein
MGPVLVVTGAEGVGLELEMTQRLGRSLHAQIALEGLVETLDLAAVLRVVGGGVLDLDAVHVESGCPVFPKGVRIRIVHRAKSGQPRVPYGS